MAISTILIADDDQPLVQLLKENLELEGYHVLVGLDGQVAVTLAMSQKPDLIVLDINMPITNGFDVLTYLRKTPETSSIPIIFITGIPSKTLYPVIDRHERVAYVKKPFDLNHLNSLIRQFLDKFPVQRAQPQRQTAKPEEPVTVLPYIEKLH